MMDESQEMNESEVAKVKVVLVGEASVGKSSIVSRFWNGSYSDNYNFTVGIDFYSKLVKTAKHSVKLQIWDTAGQERFRSLLPSYLRDCAVVLMVYDITNKKSFDVLDFWVNYVKQRAKLTVLVIIVGTKLDLNASRKVERKTAEEYCAQFGYEYYEVSAKTGENMEKLFARVAEYAQSEDSKSRIDDTTIHVDSGNRREKRQSRCNC
ncbi:GTP-binding protein ryh1 [Aphelenchoides besseyi]|nr:GTP-binding protein ryh1 [Aphelenchoides besseyi]KAI6201596.1 GTP-binding protein ryh1 [Aphelenchoides besseyi]